MREWEGVKTTMEEWTLVGGSGEGIKAGGSLRRLVCEAEENWVIAETANQDAKMGEEFCMKTVEV